MEDYPIHHRVGRHINIPMQSAENPLWVCAYQTPRVPLVTGLYRTDAVNVGSRIHSIEKEAYSAVLRAFIAQSDVLSWCKEGLITELRRELNITDQEHLKLLSLINSDESFIMIREWRKGNSHTQDLHSSRMDAPGYVPSSVGSTMGSVSHKILKTSHADVSTLRQNVSRSQHTSAANPSPYPRYVSPSHPASEANPSPYPRYMSHRQPTPAANPSPYPENGSHSQPTSAANRSPYACRDGQKAGELPPYFTRNAEQSMKVVIPNGKTPSTSKCGGPVRPQSKKGIYVADLYNLHRRSDIIKIRSTDKLMHKVESMIFGKEKPDPVQVEKAKSILTEHEGMILEALAKLADVSDGDDSPKQFQYHDSQEELQRIKLRMTTHKDFCDPVDNRAQTLLTALGISYG
ncbi:protein EMSY-LIKE 1-like isoform X2 [Actinidia eriantha]|uniref:protein EMSY-LIKE 1-like isoform X2 n=1 Tax=Actinidia eriantha TaxID=165200 RepID=UPI0025836866|nr:protein EMSY-LIKE 1-like isoform X2 [Actinidia eriantha]